MALIDMIPGVAEIKLAATALVVVAFLGAGGYLWWEWDDLQNLKADNAVLISNNKILQENNDVLKGNLTACLASNATNSSTITSLEQERLDSKKAVANLAAQQEENLKIVTGLNAQLAKLKVDPKNNGSVSVDLRETIRGIQAGAKP